MGPGLANYPVRCGLTVASCLRFWPSSFVPYTAVGGERGDEPELAVDQLDLARAAAGPRSISPRESCPRSAACRALLGSHRPHPLQTVRVDGQVGDAGIAVRACCAVSLMFSPPRSVNMAEGQAPARTAVTAEIPDSRTARAEHDRGRRPVRLGARAGPFLLDSRQAKPGSRRLFTDRRRRITGHAVRRAVDPSPCRRLSRRAGRR